MSICSSQASKYARCQKTTIVTATMSATAQPSAEIRRHPRNWARSGIAARHVTTGQFDAPMWSKRLDSRRCSIARGTRSRKGSEPPALANYSECGATGADARHARFVRSARGSKAANPPARDTPRSSRSKSRDRIAATAVHSEARRHVNRRTAPPRERAVDQSNRSWLAIDIRAPAGLEGLADHEQPRRARRRRDLDPFRFITRDRA